MRAITPRIFSAALLAVTVFCAPAAARVNLLEPWHPGVDNTIPPPRTLTAQAAILRGERLLEAPLSISYGVDIPLEAGARWGIRHVNDDTGISDLMIGFKYVLLTSPVHAATILFEGGAQLPTGDSSSGVGTGAVDFLLNWTLTKNLKTETGRDIDAYFGLGYTVTSENSDELKRGNMFLYRLGAGWEYDRQVRLYGEIKGFNHAHTTYAGSRVDNSGFQELYLAPGADLRLIPSLPLSAAILFGLTPESHDVGLLISTAF